MADPLILLVLAAAALIGLLVVAIAALTGWRDWLALQRLRLEDGRAVPTPAARIELADLRERVRKLEAIAAGVDF